MRLLNFEPVVLGLKMTDHAPKSALRPVGLCVDDKSPGEAARVYAIAALFQATFEGYMIVRVAGWGRS